MKDSWSIFTDDLDDEPDVTAPSIMPSSLNHEWGIQSPFYSTNPIESPQKDSLFGFDAPIEHPFTQYTIPESAPSANYQMPFTSPSVKEIAKAEYSHPNSTVYITVYFKAIHNELFKCSSSLNLKNGDYVITEADRGFDIGKVIKIAKNASSYDTRSAKKILRRANDNEIRQLSMKIEKEKRATETCQQKANELGLPMTITDTEFQLDGKKLSVYYSAKQYIDFRDLVRVLFKIFETRIWMVWFDGKAPVKSVLDQKMKSTQKNGNYQNQHPYNL